MVYDFFLTKLEEKESVQETVISGERESVIELNGRKRDKWEVSGERREEERSHEKKRDDIAKKCVSAKNTERFMNWETKLREREP